MSAVDTTSVDARPTTAAANRSPSTGRRRRVIHLYWVSDARAAKAMGVQCRALCGFWIWPGQAAPDAILSDGTKNRCKRCLAIKETAARNGKLNR